MRRDYFLSTKHTFQQAGFFLFVSIITLSGCSLQKKSKFNAALQDLTAHYNILFNANQLLKQKQDDYALSFIDSYGDMLNVYPDTTAQSSKSDKDLDDAMVKANHIINEKEQSHYIGDAYLVLGKANYLGGNYFNAAEYFSYVTRSFPKQTKLVQEAAIWKARSLLYLRKYKEAKLTLDTAFLKANPKKHIPADLYATKLQYDINVQDYEDGEQMAKKAIQYCSDKKESLRWTFILGQLQELNHKNRDAVLSYTRIIKSNAAFEMAFNANLNRIRIDDESKGIKLSRTERLLSLLLNENNNDFKDQIYYQVAEIYLLNKDINNAIKYYKLSIRASKTNQNQKGLSYLRIADIDFNQKADYVNAKKYYDSTLTNLSLNYPGYQTIQKKNNNLKLFVDRLQIIAREDTLQMLAKLDEKARAAKIDAMVANEILQQQLNAAAIVNNQNNGNNIQNPRVSKPNGSNFYFYNSNAISKGFSDFKIKWGTRKLEDDWRRSSRSTTNITANGSVTPANGDPDALPADKRRSTSNVAGGAYRQQIMRDLPLTPQLLAESNTRIYGSYLDIANFYRDILDDKKNATITYRLLLDRFPTNPNTAYVYYNLYRLYTENDVAKSTVYKDKLVKEYPETPFAKVIIDPDYAKNLNDKDAAFNADYNKVYNLYTQKKYTQAVKQTDTLIKKYPAHKQVVQLQYLRVMSEGHKEALPPFEEQLKQITENFPKDELITPLVKKHLDYINANKTELAGQPFALMNNDTSEVVFIPPIANQKQTPYRRPYIPEPDVKKPAETKVVAKQDPAKPTPGKTTSETVVITLPPKPVKEVPAVFSQRDSTNYYFVINVSTGTVDLSSSRFGLGQFNRANYPPNTIKHQLKNVGADNQLIYVGRFYSLADVKKYARAVIPLMAEIMKVPKDKYSFFMITQEDLDKLNDKKQLDSYFEYYQKNY